MCSMEKFQEIRKEYRRTLKVTSAPKISRFDVDSQSCGGSVASYGQASYGQPPAYDSYCQSQLRELLIWKSSVEAEQKAQRAEINGVKNGLSEVKEDVSTVKKDIVSISQKLDGQFGEVKELLFGLMAQQKDQQVQGSAIPNIPHGAHPSGPGMNNYNGSHPHGSPVPMMTPRQQPPWSAPPRYDSPAVYSISFNHNNAPWGGLQSWGGGSGGSNPPSSSNSSSGQQEEERSYNM